MAKTTIKSNVIDMFTPTVKEILADVAGRADEYESIIVLPVRKKDGEVELYASATQHQTLAYILRMADLVLEDILRN